MVAVGSSLPEEERAYPHEWMDPIRMRFDLGVVRDYTEVFRNPALDLDLDWLLVVVDCTWMQEVECMNLEALAYTMKQSLHEKARENEMEILQCAKEVVHLGYNRRHSLAREERRWSCSYAPM